jgi:hypothetical protein
MFSFVLGLRGAISVCCLSVRHSAVLNRACPHGQQPVKQGYEPVGCSGPEKNTIQTTSQKQILNNGRKKPSVRHKLEGRFRIARVPYREPPSNRQQTIKRTDRQINEQTPRNRQAKHRQHSLFRLLRQRFNISRLLWPSSPRVG